jgi:hypothetical protein
MLSAAIRHFTVAYCNNSAAEITLLVERIYRVFRNEKGKPE